MFYYRRIFCHQRWWWINMTVVFLIWQGPWGTGGSTTIKITPKRDSSVATALVGYRDDISTELAKTLQEKKLVKLRKHFGTALRRTGPPQNWPVQALRRLWGLVLLDQGPHWDVAGSPTNLGPGWCFLALSSWLIVYESWFGILWLAGDLATDIPLAWESLQNLEGFRGRILILPFC